MLPIWREINENLQFSQFRLAIRSKNMRKGSLWAQNHRKAMKTKSRNIDLQCFKTFPKGS